MSIVTFHIKRQKSCTLIVIKSFVSENSSSKSSKGSRQLFPGKVSGYEDRAKFQVMETNKKFMAVSHGNRCTEALEACY